MSARISRTPSLVCSIDRELTTLSPSFFLSSSQESCAGDRPEHLDPNRRPANQDGEYFRGVRRCQGTSRGLDVVDGCSCAGEGGDELTEAGHLDSSTELSEARSRIASMATDGAVMVEKACQSLLYASRVRGSAEARERLIVRLVAERDDAIARSTRLEETVRELRGRIEGRNPPTDATSAVRCGPAGGGGNGG